MNTLKTYKSNLFDDLFGTTFFTEPFSKTFMRTDISKKDGKLHFDIDMPGATKDDVSINLEDGYLTVSLKKDFQQEDYITKERLHSDYSRSFYIGCKDDTFAEASLNDGVLSVTIDDVIPQKTKRQIEIKQH